MMFNIISIESELNPKVQKIEKNYFKNFKNQLILAAGVVQGIYLLDRSNESLRFAWDPVPDADSYTINAVPWAFNEVAARLVDTDSLDNITELTTQNAVNLTGLNAGLAYNVTIVANPVAVEIFAIGFTGRYF